MHATIAIQKRALLDYSRRKLGLIDTLRRQAFLRNLGSYAGAEVINKVTRILAIVFVARSLSPEAFGLAAIALTCHEVIGIATRNGIGQRIVRATDEELASICARAHQLNFAVCGLAFVTQILAGLGFAVLTGDKSLFWMGLSLSAIFLFMPFGLVRIFRAIRNNQMHVVARINLLQVSSDNILSLVLAVSGFGAFALVLPKLITFPIWLWQARAADTWTPQPREVMAPLSAFDRFCIPIFLTESLKTVRTHADKAVIGMFLGVDALGIYYFAFNAGLGLSNTVSNAFAACLYPHLCKADRAGQGLLAIWDRTVKLLTAMAAPIFLFQALLAPVYVPIVFGEKWQSASIIVLILCLAAIPRMLSECASQIARAAHVTGLETKTTLASFAGTLALTVSGALVHDVLGAAIGLVIAAWLVEPAITFIIRQTVKRKGDGNV